MAGPSYLVAWTRRSRLLIAATAVLVASAGIVIAQQTRGDQFESITVRNVTATEAAQRVKSTFGATVDVIGDPSQSRILVSGTPQSVVSVRQFVQQLDQPARTAQLPPPQSQMTDQARRQVVSYRVRSEDMQPLANFVRSAYKPEAGVTVATDERLGQILVVANESIQGEIAALMRERGYQSNEDRESVTRQQLADQMRNEPRTTESYQLRNINWAQFEAAVAKTWGNRLSVESLRNGELLSVALPTPNGVTATMSIDRPNNRLIFDGPRSVVEAWQRVVQSVDVPIERQPDDTQWVAVQNASLNKIKQAVSYLRLASSTRVGEGEVRQTVPVTSNVGQDLEGNIFNPGQAQDPNNQGGETPQIPGGQDEGQQDDGQVGQGQGGLIGPVRIEFIPELDLIVLQGNPADVARVREIINRITTETEGTLPEVEIYPLQHVDSVAMQAIVQQVYDAVLGTRQQSVSITALLKPNALMLVGRRDAIETVKKQFLERLDVPVDPSTEFKIFHIKHMSSADAKSRLEEHYSGIAQQGIGGGGGNQITDDIRVGTAVRIRVTSDYRSNTIVVSGSPRDLEEVTRFIEGIDVVEVDGAVDEVRIFYLKNALAEELAPIVQDVMNGQLQGQAPGLGAAGQGQAGAQGLNNTNQLARIRSAQLELVTIDPEGRMRRTRSGFGYDVRVTADQNSNSLTIKGPSENMEFIKQLIEQLDRLPNAETVLKVYTIQNGDASKLLELLQALFQPQTQGGVNLPPQSATVGDSSTLVSLNFGIDTRTNSLIVSGSQADIRVVESILIRLDEDEFEDRVTVVTRLHNAQAAAVATAINGWLDGRNDLNSNEDLFSIYQQYDRTIIVVAEENSNSLIVSASRKAMPEIDAVIESLDRRPPMVAVQVMLAQVRLSDTEEFGFEMGVQDSLLFDRGAAQGIGFNFNQSTIGNDVTTPREPLLGQGLSNLSVGRTNSTLGFGGLVLSASNESVSLLLRALKRRNRLQILSRPQVMTMENISASIQIGQRVPYITQTTLSQFGQTNGIEFQDVGVLLSVIPRVSPDGMMVLNVSATKSSLGNEADGVAISINQNGDVIRAPSIDIITANTNLMARTGQTIILGGLIETTETDEMRGVPIISDIPGIGRLFRFDGTTETRYELLIIMTPYLIENEGDLDTLQQPEYDRMSWCLADVAEVHGPIGYSEYNGYMEMNGPATIYPDADPSGSQLITPTEELQYEQYQPMPEDNGSIFNAPANGSTRNGYQSSAGLPPFNPELSQNMGYGSRRVTSAPQMQTVPVRQQQAIAPQRSMENFPTVQPAEYRPQTHQLNNNQTYDGMVRPMSSQQPVSGNWQSTNSPTANYQYR